MKHLAIDVRTKSLQTFVLTVMAGLGCATQEPLPFGDDGADVGGSVGSSGAGGRSGSNGTTGGRQAGGTTSAGGTVSTGGRPGAGGAQAVGGNGAIGAGGAATGGSSGAASTGGGGSGSTGGATTAGTGGTIGRGGAGAGGSGGAGAGSSGGGGNAGTGGAGTAGTGTAGTGTAGAPSTTLDCAAIPDMPTGGTVHSGNMQGGKDNLAWQIWSNGGSGSLTTFSTAAFIATWNNSGDYLGRLGFEWGNAGKAFSAYGDITADLAFKKNGTAGQYSYVGMYGWSTNPCIEWYIVDDSYSAMPFNTGTAPSGTADLDGGTYNLVKRNTTGTGGNRCGNVTAWDQFYSIRKTGRQCGTISVSEHFKIWDARGWKLGNLLEVKILVEAASGSGSVDFAVADVKKTL